MKKLFMATLIFVFTLSLAACEGTGDPENGPEDEAPADNTDAPIQKSIDRISLYDQAIPKDFEVIDYGERALRFDSIAFDRTLSGDYLPLYWEDTTYDAFGFPSYVGDTRSHQDGSQEGVATISAVLSATLMGEDKTEDNGTNHVRRLNAYYNPEEGVVLNNINGSSASTSMWYALYPAILYSQVSLLYPDESTMREQTISTIEQWYQAHTVMEEEDADYGYTGFDFSKMEPYDNGQWQEPDSAAGIGMLMYYGYQLTGEDKYLEALKDTMRYLDEYSGSPMYEVLLNYAPFLSAYLNAEHGMDLGVSERVDEIFSGQSIPRGGWGKIVGTWGDYPADGLIGSTNDRGGYAFAMNTFAAAQTIPSFLQYQPQYASSMGQWLLHLSSNSKYFFADQTEEDHQSCQGGPCLSFSETVDHSVPYEGIINNHNSRTPWFGGDPTINGWAETDFSLYSGAATGMLGSMIEKTDVKTIPKFKISNLDSTYPYDTYLLYNPNDSQKTVTYETASGEPRTLFDLVKKETLETGSDQNELTLKSKESVLVMELPEDEEINHDGLQYRDSEGTLLTMDTLTATITNHDAGSSVSGDFDVDFGVRSTVEDDTIETIEVSRGDTTFTFENTDTATLSTDDFEVDGSRRIDFTITTKSGLKDELSLVFRLE